MINYILGLGLQSSCDETAAAVVRDGRSVLSNIISSQIDLHREYYGVVPEIASRAHLETINILIDRAMKEAGVGFRDLHYVAATNRPGLVGSLLIALQSAKVISYSLGIPLIGVSHLEAHLYAPFLLGREPAYPYIGLLVSGGNTVLYHVRGVGDMEIIGRTADDAAGEAFDKIAKYMDLGYPGGPVIEKLAHTAVRPAFAAARSRGIRSIVVAGGVAANGRLRDMLDEEKRPDEEIIIPPPVLCTDNAATGA